MCVRLDLVGTVTRGMPVSLAFYGRLGLEAPPGSGEEPHAEATTPEGLRIAWDTAEPVGQIYPDYTQPSAVGEKYAELATLGHGHRESRNALWGQRYAVVEDPDGNHVDLSAPL